MIPEPQRYQLQESEGALLRFSFFFLAVYIQRSQEICDCKKIFHCILSFANLSLLLYLSISYKPPSPPVPQSSSNFAFSINTFFFVINLSWLSQIAHVLKNRRGNQICTDFFFVLNMGSQSIMNGRYSWCHYLLMMKVDDRRDIPTELA